MKKFMQKRLKNEKGMTLIELLAVIVILAIIAAIAIPAIGNIIENSKVGAIKSDATNVLSAANLYFTDNPDLPGPVKVTELVTPASGGSSYLDDAASFKGDANAEVTKGGLLSGTAGKADDVQLVFGSADKAAINSTPNNSGDTPATDGAKANSGGEGTVKVTGRD